VAQGIVTLSELDVPIYITETGVADGVGDRRRVFMDTYLPEVMLSHPTILQINGA
jgi:hypothetical protein